MQQRAGQDLDCQAQEFGLCPEGSLEQVEGLEPGKDMLKQRSQANRNRLRAQMGAWGHQGGGQGGLQGASVTGWEARRGIQ